MKSFLSSRGVALIALTGLFVLVSNTGTLACAACYGDTTGSKMGVAADWGIIAMVIIMLFMLSAVAAFGWHLAYRARHPLPDYEGPDETRRSSAQPRDLLMTFALLMESLDIAPNASLHGYAIDSMLEMLHWFMLVLFVGWGSFYAYTLWRFQAKKNPKANYVGATSHLPTKLEGAVLVLEVVLLMSFAAPIWAARVDQFPSGPDVTHLAAVGQQFQWDFQYTGPDGKLGHRDIKLVSPSNPLGLDRNDPDAADDLTAVNEMHLPVNKPCIVDVMSRDVIHDFCIPNMRVAQDAIPGARIPLWFIPVKTGTYEIVCGQLCGSNHSYMRGILVVESEADYKKWFDETAKLSGAKVVEGRPVAPADSSVSSLTANH